MNNPFSLLRNKEIIAILDGDTKYGDYEFEDFSTIKISMPYLGVYFLFLFVTYQLYHNIF